jgi:hypothetical protein
MAGDIIERGRAMEGRLGPEEVGRRRWTGAEEVEEVE